MIWFYGGDLDLFQNFNVCDKFAPANVEDGAETALTKAPEETCVTAVGNKCL